MFWSFLSKAAQAALHLNKAVSGVGAALLIAVGIYDYMQKRKRDE